MSRRNLNLGVVKTHRTRTERAARRYRRLVRELDRLNDKLYRWHLSWLLQPVFVKVNDSPNLYPLTGTQALTLHRHLAWLIRLLHCNEVIG